MTTGSLEKQRIQEAEESTGPKQGDVSLKLIQPENVMELEEVEECKTPTGSKNQIPATLKCPPAPSKKRRVSAPPGSSHVMGRSSAAYELSFFESIRAEEENPEGTKFREQGPKFWTEMEFLFKGIVATSFAAYAPSEGSRVTGGLNMGAKDDIDNETEIEMNETKIGATTQVTSSRENGQRKRGREEKRVRVAAKLSAQLDHVIDQFESSSSESENDAFSIGACIDKLKNLPGLELGSELFFIGIRLMNKKANRLAFVHLGDSTLQLGWLKSHSWADVS